MSDLPSSTEDFSKDSRNETDSDPSEPSVLLRMDAAAAGRIEHLPESGQEPGSPGAIDPADGIKTADPVPPGPGLGEAVLWSVSTLGVHLIAAIGVTIALAVWLMIDSGPDSVASLLQDGDGNHEVLVMSGQMGLFVIIVLLATLTRLEPRQCLRRLGNAPLLPLHGFCILLLLPPLAIVAGHVYQLVLDFAWSPLLEKLPALRSVDQLNAVESVGKLSGSVHPALLILVVAVGPAIGEELVFRGVIGRGLVARHGRVIGLLLTSLLFALVHVHPVHVAGVFLLGVAMHFVHLSTRSFFAPVLLHLANNALAVTSARANETGVVDAGEPTVMPIYGVLLSISLLTAIAMLMWQTRVLYVTPDGSEWSPGYESIEGPAGGTVQRVRGRAPRLTVFTVCCLSILFLMLYGSD